MKILPYARSRWFILILKPASKKHSVYIGLVKWLPWPLFMIPGAEPPSAFLQVSKTNLIFRVHLSPLPGLSGIPVYNGYGIKPALLDRNISNTNTPNMVWKGNGHPSWHHRSPALRSGKTGCLSQKYPVDGPKVHGQGHSPFPCTTQVLHKQYNSFLPA